MKITNKMDLPVVFSLAADKDTHDIEPHRYSVTELLMPVRAILLRREHYHEVQKDVADMIPTMLGTAVHEFLEHSDPMNGGIFRCEEPVEAVFGEDTLSGRIDRLNLWDFSIEDYKTCSVSKVMKNDFKDWYMQGMMYALLVWKQRGVIMKYLRFYAIMKDWSKMKSMTAGNYPASAVHVWKYEVKESDYDFIEKWVVDRLAEINSHKEAHTFPECTPEECWYTGDKWAVRKKPGDKRATVVCSSEKEAREYVDENLGGEGEIERRAGEPLKCKYYCDYSRFCKKGGCDAEGIEGIDR